VIRPNGGRATRGEEATMVAVEVMATDDVLADGIRTALERGEVGVQVAMWGPDGLIAEGWAGPPTRAVPGRSMRTRCSRCTR